MSEVTAVQSTMKVLCCSSSTLPKGIQRKILANIGDSLVNHGKFIDNDWKFLANILKLKIYS